MTNFVRLLTAAFVCTLVMALAPTASAQISVIAQENQCGGVASWERVREGMNEYGNGFAEFKVTFPAPTAACSHYFAAVDTTGEVWHGGQPAGSGPYAMSVYCNTTMNWWWQVPWNCRTIYGINGTMEWASGATALYRVDDDGTWQEGDAVTFGNRILETGTGEFFPSRWKSTFALTGDYTLIG